MKNPHINRERRHWIRFLGLFTSAGIINSALAQQTTPESLNRTPAQMEGPFYPLVEPTDADFDLLKNGTLAYAKGQPCWIEGTVIRPQGSPLLGATMEIWQCDADGHYHHPQDGANADPAFQGFGRVRLDAQGRFRFRTIKPVPYPGRTPHIHVKIKMDARELLTTQLYVQGDPGNAADMLWRRMPASDRAAVTAPFVPAADGLAARYSLVVSA